MVSRRARDVSLCLFSVILFTVLFHVFRPRNNRTSITTNTYSLPNSPNLLLTSISGLSVANLTQFLTSVRHSVSTPLMIVLFVDPQLVTTALEATAQRWNATLERRQYTGRLAADATAWRFAEFSRWMSIHHTRYKTDKAWVLLLDARDIFFQRDIFSASQPAESPVNFFALPGLVRSDAMLAKQVTACVGKAAYDKLQDHTPVSSSAVLASYEGGSSYSTLMNYLLEQSWDSSNERSSECTEEGLQVALAYNQSQSQAKLWPEENRLFYTAKGGILQRNADGEAVTSKSLVPCVVHTTKDRRTRLA